MPTTSASGASSSMVTGLFRDPAGAEQAIAAATARGYAATEINAVIDADVRRRYLVARATGDPSLASDKLGSVDLGGPAGGALGTLITAITAVGTFLLVPGLIVAGPIAQALAAAGAAAVTGGLIGALHDWGIPNERIARYEAAIKASGILLGVRPKTEDDARLFAREWKALGAENLES